MLNRRTTFIGLALAVAMGGCSDTTAPNTPITVTVTLDAPPTPAYSTAADGPRITCTFGLTARAKGSGTAQWWDVQTLWHFGPDRTVIADTTFNTAAQAQETFGTATISGGETRHATWYLYAGAPFEADVGFSYQTPNGTTSTASTHVTCGATPQGAVVPTITQLSVPTTTGELKVGDVINVTYQASGASGIWESLVQVTGGFQSEQRFGEQMATTVNHTVQFVVPNNVKPGIPITISAIAWNGALVGSSRALNTQLKFVDRTPPTITSAQTRPNALAGQYAVGDTLTVTVYAHDDAALGWLVYQLGAPANLEDSVAASPGAANQSWVVNLPVQAGWVGSPTLSFVVRDASGLTSQTVSSAPDSIRIYPIVDRPTTPALSLSTASTEDMVYDAKRDLMYIGIEGSSAILVLSPGTMTLQAAIQLPQPPMGMDLSLSGDSLLAAMPLDGTIAVVDLNDRSTAPSRIRLSVLDTMALTPGVTVAPTGLRIAANGKMLVALTNRTVSGDQTVEVDLTTGAQRVRLDARGLSAAPGSSLPLLGQSRDRSRVYALSSSCTTWYSASTDSFRVCLAGMGSQPYGYGVLTFDGTGEHLTRGPFVYDKDMNLLWDLPPVARIAPFPALSPDGGTVYLAAGKSLTTARLADRTMLSRTPLPVSAERLFIAPNGQWVLAFQNSSGARVTRVDLQ